MNKATVLATIIMVTVILLRYLVDFGVGYSSRGYELVLVWFGGGCGMQGCPFIQIPIPACLGWLIITFWMILAHFHLT